MSKIKMGWTLYHPKFGFFVKFAAGIDAVGDPRIVAKTTFDPAKGTSMWMSHCHMACDIMAALRLFGINTEDAGSSTSPLAGFIVVKIPVPNTER